MKNCRYLAALLTLLVSIDAEAQPRPRIAANDLRADVSFLASDALQGRGTPSPGLDIAAEYIAAQFRRAGLTPAGDDGYFQTADFQSVTPVLDGLELIFEADGTALKVDKATITLLEAVAAEVDRVPVVSVRLDDPAVLDALTPEKARGKVLLCEIPAAGGAAFALVRRISAAAARLEPSLVILLRTSPIGLSSRARLRDASAPSSRTPMLAVWDPALRTVLASAGQARVSAHIPAPSIQTMRLRNVVGLQRGADPSLGDTYVVVSAHYDHMGVRGTGDGDNIYNGANDDASGTATVIETARALASLPDKPKRSVVFIAFFGEEAGGLGSKFYCQHPIFPLAGTIADINLEQLGRTDDTEGPRPLQFNLTGFDYTDIAAVFRQAGEDTGIKVVKHERNSDLYFSASDNAPFAELGIPSTTLSVAYTFPDYHKPGDEWPKLDYENMAAVDNAIALGIFRMADSAAVPHWNASNPKVARYLQAVQK